MARPSYPCCRRCSFCSPLVAASFPPRAPPRVLGLPGFRARRRTRKPRMLRHCTAIWCRRCSTASCRPPSRRTRGPPRRRPSCAKRTCTISKKSSRKMIHPPAAAFLDALAELLLLRETSKDDDNDEPISYTRARDLALQAAAASQHGTAAASSLRLLEYSLAMRAGSPHCELFRGLAVSERQLAVENSNNNIPPLPCSTRVEWWCRCRHHPPPHPKSIGRRLWSSSRFNHIRSASSSDGVLIPGEVPQGGGGNSDNNTTTSSSLVVLYANLGTRQFATHYRALQAAGVRFVVRHYHPDDDDSTTHDDAHRFARLRRQSSHPEHRIQSL